MSASSLPSCFSFARLASSTSAVKTNALLSLAQAWPLLQERYDKIKNPQTGQLDLLNPRDQTAMNKQLQTKSSSNRHAAVLVLLLTVDGQPSLLFTRRAAHLSQHAAEISFPGGHFDEARDVTLQDTAMREALEELYPAHNENQDNEKRAQLDFQRNLKILGTASSLPSIRGVPVTPVLAVNLVDQFQSPITQYLPGDGGTEVELVFSVPIAQLVAEETTHTLPATRFNFQNKQAPCFPTSDGNIWGLTAYILRPYLHKLLKPVFWQSK